MVKRGDDERCLEEITEPPIHPHKCKAGSARLRPHRAIMMTLKKYIVKSGAEADLERALPYLYRMEPDGRVKEAILDVVVTSPGCLQTIPVDVTIRCPHGLKDCNGRPLAAYRPSTAAAEGEQDKLLRYDESVMPLAFETYG
eukprot:4050513-Karenia_brevis.AAC.1